MPNERLQLEIVARASGQAEVEALTNAINKHAATQESAGKRIGDANAKTANVVDISTAAHERNIGTLQKVNAILGSVATSSIHAAEAIGAVAYAGQAAFAAIASSAAGSAAAVAGHGAAMESVVDTYRLARVLISPTIFTAASIGVGVLVETLAHLTLAQADANQAQAVFSARSKLSIGDTQQLQQVVRNLGADLGTVAAAYSSFSAGGGTGGIAGFGAELQKLGNISDPVARTKAAFTEFGSDVGEKVLPLLNSRFLENAQRVQSWGITLDQTARQNIANFASDIKSLADPFHSLEDVLHTSLTKAKVELSSFTAQAYADIKSIVGLAGFVVGNIDLSLPAQKRDNDFLGSVFPGSLSPGDLTRGRSARDAFLRQLPITGVGNAFSDQASTINASGARDREIELLSGRVSTARSLLFPTTGESTLDPVSKSLVEQSLVTNNARLTQLKAEAQAEKDAQTAAEAAAKAYQTTVETFRKGTDAIALRLKTFGFDPTATAFSDTIRSLQEGKEAGLPAADLQARAVAGFTLVQRTAKQQSDAYFASAYDQVQSAPDDAGKFRSDQFKQKLTGDLQSSTSAVAADRQIATILLDSQRSGIERQAAGSQRIAGLSDNNPSTAIQTGYQIQIDLASKLYQIDLQRAELEDDSDKKRIDQARALADFQKEADSAAQDRALKLIELQHQKTEQFSNTFADALLALQGGTNSARSFGLGIGRQAESKVLQNLGGVVFDGGGNRALSSLSVTQDSGSFLGKLLKGTPFGPHDAVNSPVTLNTTATNDNTNATLDLVSAITGQPTTHVAGGSLSLGSVGTFGSDVNGIVGQGSAVLKAFGIGGGGGTSIALPTFGSGGGTSYSNDDGTTTINVPTFGGGTSSAISSRNNPIGTILNAGDNSLATNIGAGVQIAGAGYAAYNGIAQATKGGARNIIGGIGQVAGAAAILDPEPISKAILGGVALASSIVTGIIGDPKAIRQQQIDRELRFATYEPNPSLGLTFGTNGDATDFNAAGGVRTSSFSNFPINIRKPALYNYDYQNVQVPGENLGPFANTSPTGGPASTGVTVNQYISAMDSKSFMDQKDNIASATRAAIQQGHPLVNEIQQLPR